MKIRLVLLGAIVAVALFILVGCGGGGAAGIVDMAHEGDYYIIAGGKVSDLANSDFYKKAKRNISNLKRAVINHFAKAHDYDMAMAQLLGPTSLISTDRNENIEFFGGPFSVDMMKDYFEKVGNWEVDDDDVEGHTLFYNKKQRDNEDAFTVAAGGLALGKKDALEDFIKAWRAGKKRLNEDKDFNKARPLVDFTATFYSLHWDDENLGKNWANRLAVVEATRLDDDSDFKDALESIEAIGTSSYFRNNYEVVHKVMFKGDGDAEDAMEFLEDEKDKLLEKNFALILGEIFGGMAEVDDIDELEDNVNITRAGEVITIKISFNWEDIEEFFKRD